MILDFCINNGKWPSLTHDIIASTRLPLEITGEKLPSGLQTTVLREDTRGGESQFFKAGADGSRDPSPDQIGS